MSVVVPLVMSVGQRLELEAMARSQVLPYRQVRQARALLWAGDGVANVEIARRLGSSASSVRRWRGRFEVEGTASVGRVRAGRGRRAVIGSEVIEEILLDTLHSVPEDGSSVWSTRAMAQRHGVGKDTVARIWRSRGLRPWRADVYKLSTDPD